MRFQATRDFWSPELNSQYAKGGLYTVRPGKAYDRLRALLPGWLADGRVVEVSAPPAALTNVPPTLLERLGRLLGRA